HDSDGIGDACELPVISEFSITRERKHFDCQDLSPLCCVDPPACSCCCVPDRVQSTQVDIDLVTVTGRVSHAEGSADIRDVELVFKDPPSCIPTPYPGSGCPSNLKLYDTGGQPIDHSNSPIAGTAVFSGDSIAGDGVYTRRFYFASTTLNSPGSCISQTDLSHFGGVLSFHYTSASMQPDGTRNFDFSVLVTDAIGNTTSSPPSSLPIQETVVQVAPSDRACGQPSGNGGC